LAEPLPSKDTFEIPRKSLAMVEKEKRKDTSKLLPQKEKEKEKAKEKEKEKDSLALFLTKHGYELGEFSEKTLKKIRNKQVYGDMVTQDWLYNHLLHNPKTGTKAAHELDGEKDTDSEPLTNKKRDKKRKEREESNHSTKEKPLSKIAKIVVEKSPTGKKARKDGKTGHKQQHKKKTEKDTIEDEEEAEDKEEDEEDDKEGSEDDKKEDNEAAEEPEEVPLQQVSPKPAIPDAAFTKRVRPPGATKTKPTKKKISKKNTSKHKIFSYSQ
jgi:hypothetical protein